MERRPPRTAGMHSSSGCSSGPPGPCGAKSDSSHAGRTGLAAVVLLVLAMLVAGCTATPGVGTEDGQTAVSSGTDCSSTAGARFPDVVEVELEAVGEGMYSVAATLCSAYDTAERYADAWRVVTPDGEVLGVRELLHDHAGEQPFTRSLNQPISVPDGVERLVVEGRDLVNGWGGATTEVAVP